MGGRGGRIFQENKRASILPIFEDDRRIQQPDNYNKKKLSELGITEHLHFRTSTNIKMHERLHFLDHSEQAGVFDKNGKMIYYKRGTQTSVNLPTDLLKDNIFTHNHPAAIPVFSPNDIETFVSAGCHEGRVTGLSGQIARIWHKDATQWKIEEKQNFVREYRKVFADATQQAMDNAIKLRKENKFKEKYEGMTEYYFDNYPDYIKTQIEYIEKNMNFAKHGINYSRTKEF